MLLLYLLVLAAATNLPETTPTNWAILVAGSKGYWNYRHQADVCHAYQILHGNGFSDDHIIVMMYDDIANNTENPFKGNIINVPDGPNVYEGVPKDYTGDNVSVLNFLNILMGIKTPNTTKVLMSGPNDNVFIYFADHGATGLIAFPNEYLYAYQLIDALNFMNKWEKYNKLVIYVEACESGSMFNGILPKDINVYAVTASTPFESSYACFYDQSRETYLADAFSVNWLQYSSSYDVNYETLQEQFEIDRVLTKMSTVCQYGNLTISTDALSEYLTPNPNSTTSYNLVNPFLTEYHLLNSRSVQFEYYSRKGNFRDLDNLFDKFVREYEYIISNYDVRLIVSNNCDSSAFIDFFGNIINIDNQVVLDTRCMQQQVEAIERNVGKLSDIGLSMLKHISHICYKPTNRN